jgi:nucleotide-binding universal stress UspA family protein
MLAGQMGWQEKAPLEAVFVLTPPPTAHAQEEGTMRARAAAPSSASSRASRAPRAAGHCSSAMRRPDPALCGPGSAVLSTHGEGGFERFLLGSVASDLLRTAPCSVLLVPPHSAPPRGFRSVTPPPSPESFHRFG